MHYSFFVCRISANDRELYFIHTWWWSMAELKMHKTDFEDFLNELPKLASQDELNEKTANNLRTASTKLLPYIPEDKPVSEWSVNDIIGAFSEVEEVTDSAIVGYRSRLSSAIKKFIAYKKGESIASPPRSVKAKKEHKLKAEVEVTPELVKTFELPIPLRESLILNISNLPRDLTNEEAERICRIVQSFALPPAKQEF